MGKGTRELEPLVLRGWGQEDRMVAAGEPGTAQACNPRTRETRRIVASLKAAWAAQGNPAYKQTSKQTSLDPWTGVPTPCLLLVLSWEGTHTSFCPFSALHTITSLSMGAHLPADPGKDKAL